MRGMRRGLALPLGAGIACSLRTGPARIDPAVGCYELTLGAWRPGEVRERSGVPNFQPRWLLLDSARLTRTASIWQNGKLAPDSLHEHLFPVDTSKFVAHVWVESRDHPLTRAGWSATVSGWKRTRGDSIDVTLNNHDGGWKFSLVQEDGGIRGMGGGISHGMIHATAPVTGKRGRCPS